MPADDVEGAAERRHLELVSTSRAQDAGVLAAADLATIATHLGVRYRVLGGVAVTLLTWVHGVAGRVPARDTADADFGAPANVVADERLAEALRDLGYRQGAGNRFLREIDREDGPLELAVDLLIPAHGTAMQTNVPAGELTVDAVPGLALALARRPTTVDVVARLSNGQELVTVLLVPDAVSALCLKAYAYRGRFAARDAVDIWRLLEVADAAGVRATDWELQGAKLDAARILYQFFVPSRAQGPATATRDTTQQVRIRALIRRIVAAPPA